MKLFINLSDKHKERAIHMAEHIVIDNLLSDGISIETNADSEITERFEKITALIEEAKKMEDPADQAELLIDNDLTGEIILKEAYEIASTALYIEKNEIAFELRDIDSHYSDEDFDGEDSMDDTDDGNDESDATSVNASKSPKKDLRQLN